MRLVFIALLGCGSAQPSLPTGAYRVVTVAEDEQLHTRSESCVRVVEERDGGVVLEEIVLATETTPDAGLPNLRGTRRRAWRGRWGEVRLTDGTINGRVLSEVLGVADGKPLLPADFEVGTRWEVVRANGGHSIPVAFRVREADGETVVFSGEGSMEVPVPSVGTLRLELRETRRLSRADLLQGLTTQEVQIRGALTREIHLTQEVTRTDACPDLPPPD
ncbi:MAG: hypothetical protein AAGE52_27115 [Myxococcota bacterium]